MDTCGVGKEFQLILRHEKVGEIGEVTDLIWKTFEFVFRQIQLSELAQIANLLEKRHGKKENMC